jgi:hypothetical protein
MGPINNTNGLFVQILNAFLRNDRAFRLLLPYDASRANNSLESTSTADHTYIQPVDVRLAYRLQSHAKDLRDLPTATMEHI